MKTPSSGWFLCLQVPAEDFSFLVADPGIRRSASQLTGGALSIDEQQSLSPGMYHLGGRSISKGQELPAQFLLGISLRPPEDPAERERPRGVAGGRQLPSSRIPLAVGSQEGHRRDMGLGGAHHD